MRINSTPGGNELTMATALREYEHVVAETDRFAIDELNPVLLGLYGEVGSIMASAKKYRRERSAYPTYKDAAEEEFGDALWYFSALCRRLNVASADLFDAVSTEMGIDLMSESEQCDSAPTDGEALGNLDSALMALGAAVAQLFGVAKESRDVRGELVEFARLYIKAVQETGISFAKVVRGNANKVRGRFASLANETLPDFDEKFLEEEQLPRHFEMHITQRKSGRSYLRWNGVFIGSPLTDNIRDADGYRFHDVFHLAHAAILHWSPTFRALINQKRKSDPIYDEVQDGGRAIVVEEGLTAWLFSYSKGLNLFEGHNSVSFDALKTVQRFVQGYEVEQVPLSLWESAILQGYSVFRQVSRNNGGVVVGDRGTRTLSYRPGAE